MLEKYTPSALKLSAGAVEKILSLSSGQDDKTINLRVYVTGGGCSGFQYGFSFDEIIDEEDTCISRGGVVIKSPTFAMTHDAGSLESRFLYQYSSSPLVINICCVVSL